MALPRPRTFSRSISVPLLLAVFLFLTLQVRSQTTIATGSIQGTILDPSGAVIPNARVKVTNRATAQTIEVLSTSTGTYASGALNPGDYLVRVQANGFQTTDLSLRVQVGVTTAGNVRLQIGEITQVVEVLESELVVNTEQAIVQGVLTSQQIDTLPINGRNFLDMAQLEPGVQIQDGINFDPTKVGYSSISFGGRFGRTTRIEVDGLDVSDESAGTTTQDIPASAIQEFQLSQSNLDLSNELTSSGAVNVVTRSGSNSFHVELFDLFRDSTAAAEFPHPPGLKASFQRSQFGGRTGGYLVKQKLFFFVAAERNKQDLFVPVEYSQPFTNFSGGYGSPFRETETDARLDYQLTKNFRFFYRYNYFANLAVATFFTASLQPYKNKDYARTHALGADFHTGSFTHSFRFGYMKFQNDLADTVLGSSLPLANIGLSLSINNGPQTGPSLLAPQSTRQSNHQVKYDGSKTLRSHILRYGIAFNHIQVAGYASFSKLAAQVVSNLTSFDEQTAAAGHFPGGASNPLNYPVEFLTLGNGLGFQTERPALGLPAGGLGPDNRLGLYVGDTWKVRPNLTVNYGLRYVRDTGRTDSDLPPFTNLNALLPGTGDRIRQPNKNFAPQLGVAWDPWSKGKTAFHGGIGLFYENQLFNLLGGDRSLRLPTGAFLANPTACFQGQPNPIPVPGGIIIPAAAICNGSIGDEANAIVQLQANYQNQSPVDLAASNPNYLNALLAEGLAPPSSPLAPNYRSPRSLQINAGVQQEIRPGTVLSADYVRNVTTHFLLAIDANHGGDVRYFDPRAALEAVNATVTQASCPPATFAGAGPGGTQSAVDCYTSRTAGASMVDFAVRGLASPVPFGGVCQKVIGMPCAFPGVNPDAPDIYLLYPVGRSVYNALQVKLLQDIKRPFRGIQHSALQLSYSLSRFVNPGGFAPGKPAASDQDSGVQALDFRDPLKFMGPSLLDRTHQLSVGGTVDFPRSLNISFVSHFYSALPASLAVATTGMGPGEIFRTDFTGDGTTNDLLPGTKVGAFGRGVSVHDLTNLINNYNNSAANNPTPAGQLLIKNGFMTLSQLRQLGAVAPFVPLPPKGQVGMGSLRAFDLRLNWNHTFREKLTIEPSLSVYNLFNFANFDLPPNIMSGLLTGATGSVNGTTYTDRVTNRVGAGTGVFALGAPRTFEFGLRLSF